MDNNHSRTHAASTDKIDVAYVAHLARLELTAAETAQYQGQLEQILAYVAELQKLDLSGVAPLAHPVPLENVLRADTTRPGLARETVLANAPEQRHDQFVVPKIIE